jgi:hypothetical protein
MDELEQIERDGAEAYRRGDNVNPYIDIPRFLMKSEREEWENKLEAWGIGWIMESRKQK